MCVAERWDVWLHNSLKTWTVNSDSSAVQFKQSLKTAVIIKYCIMFKLVVQASVASDFTISYQQTWVSQNVLLLQMFCGRDSVCTFIYMIILLWTC